MKDAPPPERLPQIRQRIVDERKAKNREMVFQTDRLILSVIHFVNFEKVISTELTTSTARQGLRYKMFPESPLAREWLETAYSSLEAASKVNSAPTLANQKKKLSELQLSLECLVKALIIFIVEGLLPRLKWAQPNLDYNGLKTKL